MGRDIISEIFGDGGSTGELEYETFLDDSSDVEVRPSDRKYLWGRITEDANLYEVFRDFIIERKVEEGFIDTEIQYAVSRGANIVIENNGTTGVGKSQAARAIGKRIAREFKTNLIMVRDTEKWAKGEKNVTLKIRFKKSWKKWSRCFLTYAFQETSRTVRYMKEGDLVIQDEVEKETGEDSGRIKTMINNITDVAARKKQLSFIFNTPMFVTLKNLHFTVEWFGRQRNHGPITPENMISYGILYEKGGKPIAIVKQKVWETKQENEFYEVKSEEKKGELKDTGGGKGVLGNEEELMVGVKVLFKKAIFDEVLTKSALGVNLRLDGRFSMHPNGLQQAMVHLAWDDVLKFRKHKGEWIPEYMAGEMAPKPPEEKKDKKKKREVSDDDRDMADWPEDDDDYDSIEDNSSLQRFRKKQEKDEKENKTNESIDKEKINSDETGKINAMLPIIDYIQQCVKKDYGEYQERLWYYVVKHGMIFSMVAEAMETEGYEKVSHQTIATEFLKIRIGEKKETGDSETPGMGYYAEDWYANSNNDDEYQYITPHNDSKPDYIHEDGGDTWVVSV